jgi:putative transposase
VKLHKQLHESHYQLTLPPPQQLPEDYREKLASWYTQEYDAVFLEDLDVGSMMRQDRNSRNIASMSWYELRKAFEHHG